MRLAHFGALALGCTFLIACGGEGDDGDADADGTTDEGSGGSVASGGSASVGGSASGGESASGELCAPSDFTTPGWSLYPTIFDNCGDVSGVDDPDDNASFRNIDLTTLGESGVAGLGSGSVGPGETFAFSVDMDSGRGKFELWGATEKCGDAQELLESFELEEPGIICFEAAPKNGTYTHLIWVWRSAAEQLDTTICSAGTCPAR